MKAYEYYAEVLSDGHLSVPEELVKKISTDTKIRVMLLLEDNDTIWKEHTISQFMKGYSDKDAIYDNI